MATLVGYFLVCVCAVFKIQATVYPAAVDQLAANNGAPQDMTQGWSPNIDKQMEASYLQTLRSSLNQINNTLVPKPQQLPTSNVGAPTLDPTKMSFPAWLQKQFPALMPLQFLLQEALSQTSPQQQPPQLGAPQQGQVQQRSQQQSPFFQSPPMLQPPQDQSPFGPPQPYNPQTPMNQMYMPPRHFMSRPGSAECSGGYVPGQLCCDGVANPLPPGGPGQWGCCHKGIYDMTTQVCCGDIPVPKPTKGPPLMCCGTMLYDPATHLCCDAFPILNTARTMRCCRKTAYNPANEMCCGESVKPRNPMQMNMECCGKHTYNRLTHICCDEGNTMPKNPTYQCCGKKFFQPAFQQCCFGDPFPKDAFCMAK